jgi:hypothetical protein
VDDLHVNGELTAAVVEDQDTDTAAARLKGVGQARVEVGLVNDGQVGLDVTGLSHGDDVAVLHVKNAVLLEDGAKHSLHNHAGGGVGDERGLLVQLLGEEVDTKVAVLAGGARGGDADHLAGAALEHQEVTHADVVARNGHRVGNIARASTSTGRGAGGSGAGALLAVDIYVDVSLIATGFGDPISELVDSLTERVVVAVLVVVTHLGLLVGAGVAGGLNGFLREADFAVGRRGAGDGSVNGELVGVVVLGLVLRLRVGVGVGVAVYSSVVRRAETLSVFTLSDVNGAGEGLDGVGVDVNVNVSVVVHRGRCRSRSGRGGRAVLGVNVLVLVSVEVGTGTAVAFFFARDTDLFFAVFLAGRTFSVDGERRRRVLTFPSGWLLGGEFDLKLFVSGGGGGGGLRLRFAVPICGREDAEGHGDAGFKVQVGDFCWRERIFSYNLP